MTRLQYFNKTGKSKKKRIRIVMIGLALLALIGASVYTVVIRPSMQEVKVVYEATKVERGTVKVTVNESGSITYAQSAISYNLDLDVSDDDDDDEEEEETATRYLTVEEVYKASGERVSAGDALMKFNAGSIESVRKLLAAAVADAQVDYNDAKSTYELSCLEAELTYKTSLITAGYAKKTYSDSLNSVSNNITSLQAEITKREENIPSLEEAIVEAQEDYDEAYAEYVSTQNSINQLDPNGGSYYLTYQQKYLNAQTAYNNAVSALDKAKQNLQNNADQITSLKKQLSTAKASREIDSISVKQGYEEDVQSGDNAYLVYMATLESLEETLKEAADALQKREDQQTAFEELVGEDGVVYAPKDSMLVAVDVNAGDELKTQKTMISYVCADSLTISVNVTEEDVVSLSVGDAVDIEFTAYPDEHFEGIIQSIDTTATSSGTNTVSYNVVIGIEGDLTKMYGGMTVSVSFLIDSHEDTLCINRKALVESNGSYYVYTGSGVGEYELTKVTIGLKNTSVVEILSGVKENQTIYIATTGN